MIRLRVIRSAACRRHGQVEHLQANQSVRSRASPLHPTVLSFRLNLLSRMNLIYRHVQVVAAALALAASANAQIADSTVSPMHDAMTINQCDVPAPIIAGAPVFYEHVIERPVKAFLLERMHRDFAGRTRIERPIVDIRPELSSTDPPVIVEIYDPVLGFCYALDQSRHVAHRVKVVAPSKQLAPYHVVPRYLTFDGSTRVAEPGSSSAQLREQDLGMQLINDLQAEGRRTTQRFSNGAVVITESWKSPEVNRIILVKRYDGPSQEGTMHIDLNRHPPDPSFFAVPEGYTIVEETGQFSIQF
jgi:hypothetical protein